MSDRAVVLFVGLVRLNQRLAGEIRARLRYVAEKPDRTYVERVAELMNARPGQLVLDIGGGRSSAFAHRRLSGLETCIVAVDIDESELALNTDVDEKRVADVSRALPFGEEEADMIVSSSTLEHLPDVGRFVAESARVLKPGGWFVHAFPGRNTPYAIVNRLLPERISQRIIHFLVPGSDGILGYPAYYDRCSPRAMEQLLAAHDFEIRELETGYEQAVYFNFFLPLYVGNVAYDLFVRALHLRELGARHLIVACKGGSERGQADAEDR